MTETWADPSNAEMLQYWDGDQGASAAAAGTLKDPEQTRELLASAGFSDVTVRGINEPMYSATTSTTRTGSSPGSSPG